MYTTTLALAISLAVNLPIASAGPFAYHNHQSSIRTVHRRHRHHAQADVAVVQPAERADVAECDVAARAVTSCENGAWRCEGSQLQRCSWDSWLVIQNCTGDNVVCSSDPASTGCVWTWSVASGSDSSSSASSSAPSDAASTSSILAASVAASSTSSAASAAACPSASHIAPVLASTPTTDDSDDNDDEEDCDEDDSQTTTTSAAASAVLAVNPSATASASASSASDGDNSGDDDCDDESDDTSSASQASATVTSASASITASASTSVIGGNLAAHHTSSSQSSKASANATSYDDGQWHQSSQTYDDGKWHPSSTDDAWTASSTVGNWTASSTTGSLSASHGSSAKGKATATVSVSDSDSIQTASVSSRKSKGISGSASASVSATGSVSVSASAASPSKSSSSGSATSWSAPHYVIYSDNWMDTMPDASLLSSYNRFILAFWMSDRGAVDNAQMWEQFTDAYRQQIITDYHAAGVALMVSAFGSTDAPTMNGVDPTTCAQQLAAWVKQYGLDGVDIDYEDMPAMNSNKAEAWLITFQTELRRQLPAGQYLISHAPVAPWFTSAADYVSGAYVEIHQQVGSGIDFYNIQFYNQGDGVYEDCNSLIFDSGSSWPSTSVMEINSYAGVPLNKIVLGKPLDIDAADNGYVDPFTLHTCVTEAQAKGWNGGVMFWEWTSDAPAIMATVRG